LAKKVPETKDIIIKDPGILGGRQFSSEPGFPSKHSWTIWEGGQTLDEFLDDFPTVTRARAVAALEHAKALVVSSLE